VRRVVAVGLALGLAAVVGFLARAPLQGLNADRAALRFTWRLRGEEVVECRRPTEADLADLPVHMRNPDACVGDIPPFVLEVSVGGETRITRVVRPAGARGDRPLYVFEELWLEPGRYEIVVNFRREGTPDAERQGAQGQESTTRELHLDTMVELAAGQALIVTRDAGGALEIRRPQG
jgi:hypothetical protein